MNEIGKVVGDIQQGIPEASKTVQKGTASFDTAIKDAIKAVSEVQNDADNAIQDFSKGNVKDVHTVVVAMEKADVSMQTLLQVRNKLLAAYSQIMGMQV